ncbi:MAG: PEGA domain-containing protein [Planctomycetes bacterium]|nr:PEGA domain-containing protein [Planctomycetota bacterium]
MKRWVPFALALLVSMTGCVERWISIRSEPAGAEVFLDGEPAGITPVDIPYAWYGGRALLLVKPGYRSLRHHIVLSAPWWQIFPFDLITDVLLPIPLTDRTELVVALDPEPPKGEDLERVRARAEAFEREGAAPLQDQPR